MTVTVSKLDALGYYAVETATITWSDHVPPGYVVADPPEPVEGKFAFWTGDGWGYNETGPAGVGTVTISAIDGAGYYAGQVATISAAEGCPVGWVRAAPPEPAEGMHAYWAGDGWAETEVGPAEPLDQLIEAECKRIDAERDRRQALDFAYDFGATPAKLDDDTVIPEAGVRYLQMGQRNRQDWQGVMALATAAVQAEAPNEIFPARVSDNANVLCPAWQFQDCFKAGAARDYALLMYGGARKTIVRAQTSATDVAATIAFTDANWPAFP